MLNELAILSRSLDSFEQQKWHQWIKTVKKGEALVAELDSAGILARVSTLSQEQVAGIRNIAPDFHNSFPCFNLNCPLFALENPAIWNQPEALWQSAVAASPDAPIAYLPGDLKRLGRLLREFPLQEIAPKLSSDSPKLQSTLAVLRRLAQARFEPESFLRQLRLRIIAAVENGSLSQPLAISVLYGKPNKKTLGLEHWKTTLLFDVTDLENFPYRVADPAVAAEWSKSLLASEVSEEAGSNTFICSLNGKPDSLMDDKMPSPNLPILGPTVLMSMNRDIPCQTRYGQTSTAIFRVGKASIQGVSDALQFITEPARRNKTWAAVPNGNTDKPDLLIAYLEMEPEADIQLSGLFADLEASPEQELAVYEARTAQICRALQLRNKEGKDDEYIVVIALSQIDKGRKQVLFSGRYQASSIFKGRDRWIEAAHNAPAVVIPFPVGKGKPVVWRNRNQPGPAEVMASFKRQWLRAGQTSQHVPGVDIGRIYGLLLEPDSRVQAGWLMERYLGLIEPLMIGLARSLSGGASLSASARNEALTSISILGILLYQQGRIKETYMESRDYLLGQFLQLADLLHKLYCENVRGGSIPPQLIGNAAIPMALHSPRRALGVLGNRMPVYLAWAERYQGDNAGLAKWTRKELARISALLHDEDLDLRVGPNGKAELLLGYLASNARSDKQGERI